MTLYLLDKLPAISAEMRNDIEIVYKYNMVKNDTKGTINRDGTADKLYYFAQTDPDWAEEIFEFEGNGATLKDRGCGCACAAMVFQTYNLYPHLTVFDNIAFPLRSLHMPREELEETVL